MERDLEERSMEKDDQQHSQLMPMQTSESTVLQPDLFAGVPVVITNQWTR